MADDLTLEEARDLLNQAAGLLQDSRMKSSADRGNNMAWGRKRKAVVDRLIETDVWPENKAPDQPTVTNGCFDCTQGKHAPPQVDGQRLCACCGTVLA